MLRDLAKAFLIGADPVRMEQLWDIKGKALGVPRLDLERLEEIRAKEDGRVRRRSRIVFWHHARR